MMAEDTTNCLYDEYKQLEQDMDNLVTRYAEVAAALGFPPNGWGEVPTASHIDIVERARELRKFWERG